jgi:phytoene dehydrogenase-like protein
MKTDVVVIGGGVAGLATGALLAKRGLRTVVLEKGNQPGGRAYAFEEKGFTLNYGPHAMYRPYTGVLADVLARLGREPIEHGLPDPMKAFWADGDRFGPVGAKPHQAMTTKFLPFSARVRLGPLMLAIRMAKPETYGDMTYGEWLDKHVGDDAVRRFAAGLGVVNTYTRPSTALSARFMIGHLKRTLFAKDYVGYMHGGWRVMYDAFIADLHAHGGQLRLGARVDTLETEGDTITAAVADGERFEAQAFVCTLPPQDAPSIAADGTPLRMELSRWQHFDDARALCMDLGFSRRLRTDLTFIYDIDHDCYFSLHSEVAEALAPAGSQLMHAMAYLSPEDAASDAALERRRAELVGGLDRFFAGWREALVVERTLPNVRVNAARRTPAQTGDALIPLRSRAATNLYFAGDARDLQYDLAETSLASAMDVADAIGAAYHPQAAPLEAVTASAIA